MINTTVQIRQNILICHMIWTWNNQQRAFYHISGHVCKSVKRIGNSKGPGTGTCGTPSYTGNLETAYRYVFSLTICFSIVIAWVTLKALKFITLCAMHIYFK